MVCRTSLGVLFTVIVGCSSGDPQSRTQDAERLLWKGAGLFDARDFDGAIACHDDAIRLDPNHLMAHVRRAQAFEGSGNEEAAYAAFKQATLLTPRDAEDFMLRAVAWTNVAED